MFERDRGGAETFRRCDRWPRYTFILGFGVRSGQRTAGFLVD